MLRISFVYFSKKYPEKKSQKLTKSLTIFGRDFFRNIFRKIHRSTDLVEISSKHPLFPKFVDVYVAYGGQTFEKHFFIFHRFAFLLNLFLAHGHFFEKCITAITFFCDRLVWRDQRRWTQLIEIWLFNISNIETNKI